MTEKEFIIDFLEHAEAMGHLGDTKEQMNTFIDSWLEYFHKEYFEVEFIKKEIEEIKLAHRCQCSICEPHI